VHDYEEPAKRGVDGCVLTRNAQLLVRTISSNERRPFVKRLALIGLTVAFLSAPAFADKGGGNSGHGGGDHGDNGGDRHGDNGNRGDNGGDRGDRGDQGDRGDNNHENDRHDDNDRDARQDDNQHDRRERERHAAPDNDVKAAPAAPVQNNGSVPYNDADNRGSGSLNSGRGNYYDRKSENNRREPKNRGVKAEDKIYQDNKGN
jgi:hypothetical protein